MGRGLLYMDLRAYVWTPGVLGSFSSMCCEGYSPSDLRYKDVTVTPL
jgi:hypothetical protein